MNKTCKILAVAAVLAAVAYTIVPFDYDREGVLGYADDFFVFMAAFTCARAAFTMPAQKAVRRQLCMVAAVCLCLGVLWLWLLAFAGVGSAI